MLEFRAKKSSTARFASPWATASSGSGMNRLDTDACKFRISLNVARQPVYYKALDHSFGEAL